MKKLSIIFLRLFVLGITLATILISNTKAEALDVDSIANLDNNILFVETNSLNAKFNQSAEQNEISYVKGEPLNLEFVFGIQQSLVFKEFQWIFNSQPMDTPLNGLISKINLYNNNVRSFVVTGTPTVDDSSKLLEKYTRTLRVRVSKSDDSDEFYTFPTKFSFVGYQGSWVYEPYIIPTAVAALDEVTLSQLEEKRSQLEQFGKASQFMQVGGNVRNIKDIVNQIVVDEISKEIKLTYKDGSVDVLTVNDLFYEEPDKGSNLNIPDSNPATSTDPSTVDSNGDGLSDVKEKVEQGTTPLDLNSKPASASNPDQTGESSSANLDSQDSTTPSDEAADESSDYAAQYGKEFKESASSEKTDTFSKQGNKQAAKASSKAS